jgi:hypothetical protein
VFYNSTSRPLNAEVLKGHTFGLDGDAKAAPLQWLQQVKGFFAERIY